MCSEIKSPPQLNLCTKSGALDNLRKVEEGEASYFTLHHNLDLPRFYNVEAVSFISLRRNQTDFQLSSVSSDNYTEIQNIARYEI